MPPQTLFDITGIDLSRVVYDQEKIREANPQRGAMEQLHGIIYAKPEAGQIIGYKDVKADEFWVEGHIPGRPLFPGVLMIEAAAQLASFYTRMFVGWKGFIGFGGVTDTKFRQQVPPGVRMYLVGLKTWERHGRIGCNVQGLVNGNVTFETSIIGTQM
jgi:3-hydroxyacyl-[acyl-carrier-protein] dehydratase